MNFTFILQPIVLATLTLSLVWWRCVANLASAFRETHVVARLKKDGVIVEAQITDWNIPWNPRKKRLRKVAFSYVVDETSYSATQIIAKKTLRAHIIEDNRIHVCYWPGNPSHVRISPLSIYKTDIYGHNAVGIMFLLLSIPLLFTWLTLLQLIPRSIGDVAVVISCFGNLLLAIACFFLVFFLVVRPRSRQAHVEKIDLSQHQDQGQLS